MTEDKETIRALYTRKGPESVVLNISPKVAQQMLLTSVGNRKMRGLHVKRLADAMLRGEWRVISQGIGFDVTGALRDGHHRLSAVVEAGVVVPMTVVLGMPETAYQVTDTGMSRTYAERLGEDRRVADVLTLGAQIVHAQGVPTVDQILLLRNSDLYEVAKSLYEYCPSTRRNYSTAPVRLAACVEVLNGSSRDFVFRQYRALCLLDFDSMTQSAKAYVRQVDSAIIRHKRYLGQGSGRREQLARALRVFDEDRKDLQKIQINENTTAASVEFVRQVLSSAIHKALCHGEAA